MHTDRATQGGDRQHNGGAMNDDWRVRAELPDAAQARELGKALASGELEHSLQSAAGKRVIISVDDVELFAYAADRHQAELVVAALTATASVRGWSLTTELHRWHPVAERWEDPELPLPVTASETASEHAEELVQDHAQAAALGYTEYEVRVTLPSHHETVALAEQLHGEGIPTLRRWRYLLVGAADEQSAGVLAERVSALAPADATVSVEATAAAIEAGLPPNPFAVFGGLGG
jgi:hypothetical protein